jgi:hypothetical protein
MAMSLSQQAAGTAPITNNATAQQGDSVYEVMQGINNPSTPYVSTAASAAPTEVKTIETFVSVLTIPMHINRLRQVIEQPVPF